MKFLREFISAQKQRKLFFGKGLGENAFGGPKAVFPKHNSFMNFDKQAHTYHREAFIQREIAEWSGIFIQRELLPGETKQNQRIDIQTTKKRAIEFGAGTGIFSQKIVEAGFQLTATDISPRMIEYGQKFCPQANWMLCNAWSPKLSSSFDFIFSSCLLQWAHDPIETLTCWRSLLKPQGHIICNILTFPTLQELYSQFSQFPQLKFKTSMEWEQIFQSAGFHIQQVHSFSKKYPFPSLFSLLKNLQQTGTTFPNSIPHAQLKSLLTNNSPLSTYWSNIFIKGSREGEGL
ncbi:MAG: hypothetical protein A2007_02215 [Verrucomicrobia bacterium GWC2_42_7]|nr:MAG: hypothetical protein A2007_02215 [Verrucomicrobia bacterium GWC2_42_7]